MIGNADRAILAAAAIAVAIAIAAWSAHASHVRAMELMDAYAPAWVAAAEEEVDPRWEGV